MPTSAVQPVDRACNELRISSGAFDGVAHRPIEDGVGIPNFECAGEGGANTGKLIIRYSEWVDGTEAVQRPGGMTELEEAELTDGQGRVLSGHKTTQSYSGYAKRTLRRALPATRRRYAHRLANAQGTNVQNNEEKPLQNEIAANTSKGT
jgi:hypothetical protein